jgi:HAD superfamily hydrolase (TIGR01549 family)
MARIEVVSFDMEGTLIDDSFSSLIWETDVPRLYAERHGLGPEEARRRVLAEYDSVGEGRPEWYDVDYWFRRFELEGDWRELLEDRREACRPYPETVEVIERMGEAYTLVVTSNTIREFLEVQLRKLPDVFAHVFSASSDFGEVKKSPQFYHKICHEVSRRPGEMVHVGDHYRFDYEAASQAGLRAYHLDRSGASKSEHSVRDLLEFEKSLSNPAS